MSQETAAAEKAHWNDQEVDALLAYLGDHHAEGGNNGTFKMGYLQCSFPVYSIS